MNKQQVLLLIFGLDIPGHWKYH